MKRISRRGFMLGSAALSVVGRRGFALAESVARGQLLLVGTQTAATSKGIYAYSFDGTTGELKPLGLATEADNPTFLALAPNGRTVIVANELSTYEGKNGAVSSYVLDRPNARLTKINEVSSLGGGTCHVAFDHTGRSAFAANYGGGSAASFSVDENGRLSPAVSFFQYSGQGTDRERQSKPHAHRVTVSPDNRFLLVNDLGLDAIHIYRLDAGTAALHLNDPPAWQSKPGSGPRALLFHPKGKFAYCVTEMTSSVVALRWNAQTGALETVQEVEMRPPDFQGATAGDDIVIDREGRFAYAADRFDDLIATFAISPDSGRLTLLNRSSCGGKVPRHLTLDPSGLWLLVANQASDNISLLARDPKTGQLAKSGKDVPLSKPQCLVFA